MKIWPLLALVALLGCSGPKDTPLPKELEKMETIKPAIEKLSPEDRELLMRYVMRNTVGARLGGLFGSKSAAAGIPDGMTIGTAIEEQKKFQADAGIKETNAKAVQDKLSAEREVSLKAMREAVTVSMISKKIRPEYGSRGMLLDEHLDVSFGYRNNTRKDIAGVKGLITMKDLFGDEISRFMVSNDETIRAGQLIIWEGSRSVKYAVGLNKDRKLGDLPNDKFTLVWEPRTIVFVDGSKVTLPE